MSPVSGVSLADMVLAHCERNNEYVDINPLDSGLSFILVDKAKIGASILHRIPNLKA